MEIIKELREIPDLSIALGFFDGLHIGHQAVINCAVKFAKEHGFKSAVVTFGYHPYCYLNGLKAPKFIMTKEDKYAILDRMGVDYLIELDFEKIRDLTAEEYIKDVLVRYFTPKAISAGMTHYFGKNKTGNVNLLTNRQEKYNYTFFATPEISLYGTKVSSTAIRNLITSGNVELAENLLGRKFSVKGTVQKGKQKGHTIGFPTANIFYPLDIVQPPFGVYDVTVELPDGTQHRGLANYGVCPTISNSGITSFETHILDFNEDIYGQDIRIEFNKRIRDEIKFSNVDQLKLQISIDINAIRNKL